MQAIDVQDDIKNVLFSKEEINAKVAELAARIDEDYAGKDVLLVGVLKGAIMIMADLSRALKGHYTMDWMAVSSYGSGTKSSGVVRILKDLDTDLVGRNVLIVEDIIDSGLTLAWLQQNLISRGAASVEICTLLRKPKVVKADVEVKYVGWDIEPEFVVGYGLDFEDGSFDAVTISWGLRNIPDPQLALREMARVVRPRGRLVVLEFSTPPSRVFRGMYNVYQSTVMPAIARLVSTNDGAYDYLVESIRAWPAQEELGRMIAANGWSEVEYRNLTGGIACMHRAVKPLP